MGCIKDKSLLKMIDTRANELKNIILRADDNLPSSVTGTVWYLSNSGNDSNCGCSKESPWKTLEALVNNASKIKSGDAVLFERGSMFRLTEGHKDYCLVRALGGVYYGAYGEGEKPVLNASIRNYACEECWTEEEKNIWTCGMLSEDTGIIVFDNAEFFGIKKINRSELKVNGDFWCDDYKLYLYCDKNPALEWESIEIGVRTTIIGLYDSPIENITIENLCLKYSGGHAVAATDGAKNIVVKNCEIGYIGGAFLINKTRYGNAVEFYGGCENILVEYNWIYDIYDSGFTHQGGGNYTVENIEVRNNLIEGCGMGSIEYWMEYSDGEKNYAKNVTYTDNIMRRAGYCWGGEQRPDKVSSHVLSNGINNNHFINYQFRGNIFDRSSCFLLEITSLDKAYPTFSDNLYVQEEGKQLGTFADLRDVIFNEGVLEVLEKDWGDSKATIIFA